MPSLHMSSFDPVSKMVPAAPPPGQGNRLGVSKRSVGAIMGDILLCRNVDKSSFVQYSPEDAIIIILIQHHTPQLAV